MIFTYFWDIFRAPEIRGVAARVPEKSKIGKFLKLFFPAITQGCAVLLESGRFFEKKFGKGKKCRARGVLAVISAFSCFLLVRGAYARRLRRRASANATLRANVAINA